VTFVRNGCPFSFKAAGEGNRCRPGGTERIMLRLRAEDVVVSYTPEFDLDRHAAANLIAYVAELEQRGVVISDVSHEVDADGYRALAFVFKIGDRWPWPLRAFMPGVPLEWMKRPAEFEEQLASVLGLWRGSTSTLTSRTTPPAST
jgi:hypothetical protein